MLDERGFDAYADEYDADVKQSDEKNRYPFAGYSEVLDGILKIIDQKPLSKVLDIGFGTGTLTAVLYDNGHEIYGQDFSSKMIEIASEKMPKAHLCHGDFSKGLVKELLDQKYDFIVSTYAMHHLSDEEKTGFIPKLLEQLKDDGTLLIGDIAFKDQNAMETCKKAMGDEWDEQECYFVADELRKRYPDLVFLPKSYCSGIFVLKKTKTWKSMNQRRLRECDYSPGYGDMRGEIHSEVLRKNNNGKWQIVRRDREIPRSSRRLPYPKKRLPVLNRCWKKRTSFLLRTGKTAASLFPTTAPGATDSSLRKKKAKDLFWRDISLHSIKNTRMWIKDFWRI